jgi:hypothetical protein
MSRGKPMSMLSTQIEQLDATRARLHRVKGVAAAIMKDDLEWVMNGIARQYSPLVLAFE